MSTLDENDPNTADTTVTSDQVDQADNQTTDNSSSDTSQTDDETSDSSNSSDNSSGQSDGSTDSSYNSDNTSNPNNDDNTNNNNNSSQGSDSSSEDSSDQTDDGSSDATDSDSNSSSDNGNSDDSSGQQDDDAAGSSSSDNNDSSQPGDDSSDNLVAQNDPPSGQSGTSSGQNGSSQPTPPNNITTWLNDDYPVRMLKVSEALQIVNYLITQSSPALQIDGNKVDQTNTTTMFTGNGVTQKIVKAYRIKPDVINGIQFKYLVSQTNPKIMGYIDNVDPRMIVFLYKFTKWLKDTWGPANNVTVTAVHHIGIGHGNQAHLFDCHNTGRAIDLGGITGTKSDGSAFTLSIYGDWGQKPAVTTNGKACFRLAQSNGLIYNFSRDFDAYAMSQCQDRSQGQDPALSAADLQARIFVTGQPTVNSFIIHPDYPDAALRQAHQDHFHVQIGPTNYESAPPL